jgi:hypothetical protein
LESDSNVFNPTFGTSDILHAGVESDPARRSP